MAHEESVEKVRVVLFGYGSVGRSVARLCQTREWIDLVGIVVANPRDGGDVPLIAAADVDAALDETRPDVAIIATRSAIDDVIADIERCAERGIAVVCSSERLTHPGVSVGAQGLARLQAMATQNGVAIAATGINPGFVFDALPLAVAGAAWDIQRISISRALDASVFGRDVHRSLGVGYSEAEFAEATDRGSIYGHIGFEESASVLAQTVGLTVDSFEETIEPVFTDMPIELRDYRIEPGQTAGVNQRATATVQGAVWVEFDLALHVAPVSIGLETRDRILIEGENSIDLRIEPGTHAVLTTSALLVNAITSLRRLGPGLYNSTDLLPGAPWLGPEPPHSSE